MKLRPIKPFVVKRPVEKALNLRLPSWINQDNQQKLRDLFEANKAGVAAGGVILAVALIFMVLYMRHQSTVEERSSSFFREGQGIYSYRIPAADSGVTPLVSSDEEKYAKASQYFQQIVENYPGSRYAPAALFYMGNCRFRMRQYAAALESYDQFLGRYSRHYFANQAYLGKGDALEQLGRHTEALDAYRKVMSGRNAFVSEASLGAVRCLLKMTELDRAKAQQYLQEAGGILQNLVVGKDPYGQKASRVMQKLLTDLSKPGNNK
jgi:tetratricopeptide (TPR) repeat protein